MKTTKGTGYGRKQYIDGYRALPSSFSYPHMAESQLGSVNKAGLLSGAQRFNHPYSGPVGHLFCRQVHWGPAGRLFEGSSALEGAGMSGRAFRGGHGAGVALNKGLRAILAFPSTNIRVWMNDGRGFTAGPSAYATAVKGRIEQKYERIDKFFVQSKSMKIQWKFDQSKFRNDEQFKCISEDDGILRRLCQAYLAGLPSPGDQSNGIYAKTSEHVVARTANRTRKSKFWHEIQFVQDKKVVCVWKLEADGVQYGGDDGQNMLAAISECTRTFNKTCRDGLGQGQDS
jgi:hypothetical protein